MSSMKQVYLMDEGVLLSKGNEQFENYEAYDHQYGYYDEDQYYTDDFKRTVEAAKRYVEIGVDMTYAVVSRTSVPEDADLDDLPVEKETYLACDVVYSCAKIDGQIVENFIKK